MFSEGNIGAIEGTELLQAVGLDAWEIQKPDVLHQYLEVAKYFEKFSDGAHIARLVARNVPNNEKLKKITEYVALRKALDDVRIRKAALPDADTVSGETPERAQVLEEEARLIQEIRLYE